MSIFDKIKKTDNKYIMNTYAPYDVAFKKGRGTKLYDTDGKEYTDFLAGIAVCSLGHANSIVKSAIRKQSRKIMSCSNYFYSEERGQLAENLVYGTHLEKVFFGNSGAEANECAMKLARKYFFDKGQNRFKIVTTMNSFHGRTLATVTATGQDKYNKAYAPLPAGIGGYIPYNDIAALEKALSNKEVAAFMLELIQGESGVIPATQEYVDQIKLITKKYGVLLIVDEVQTGCMRTGKMYAFQHYNIKPDIVTIAKGMGGGVPIGACLATATVAGAFKPGDHGTTFGSNPFCCAVSLAVIKEMHKKYITKNIEQMSKYLFDALNELKKNLAFIKDVRGKGLMIGMELNAETVSAKDVVATMLQKGFVLNACGNNVLRFLPAFIIDKDDIDKMISALKETLAAKI